MIKSTDSLSAEKFGVAKSLGRVECVRIQNILENPLYNVIRGKSWSSQNSVVWNVFVDIQNILENPLYI